MPSTSRNCRLVLKSANSRTFKSRVDLNSLEGYVNSLSEADPFALNTPEVSGDALVLCDGDLQDYEADLMRLQSQILFIEEQQARLKVHRARLRSLTSPVRKIPNEILASIFDSVCALTPNLFRELPWSESQEKVLSELISPMITYLPALSISATCSRWRSVAVSFPSLWSRLKLEITSGRNMVPGMLNALIATIDLFLARSAKFPLSISLEICGPPQKRHPFVLSLLLQHTHRWRTFKFISDRCMTDFLGYESTRDFTVLESLDLHSEHPVILKGLNIFQNATKTSRTFKTVTILQNWYKVLDATLKSFTFPALQELNILGNPNHCQPQSEAWPWLFTTFLARSSCRITTLVISASALNISAANLVSALQLLAYLVTFEISDHNEPDSESPINSVLISSLHIHGSRNGPELEIHLYHSFQNYAT
ncbi:hypothetical protein BT96DRAFT_918015 [Gymnopus androsaceus JB14]|uniref:Uncharacterized protein n=1 Tax=Gymnopus androsaceus JB14 TaxID=1447944 RepID=A0A6A4I1D1_9AGAR|nr:hypothetical protein BT96DRAFT_918015 [Gymnopus androsaceus JB14]